MKTLLLLRHAKSSWDVPNGSDHDRPLNARGERTAPRIGQLLADEQLVPDLIVSSTALRARQTAERVAQTCSYAGPIRFFRELYEARPRDHLEVLRQLPQQIGRLLVVAHNPGLEELVADLTARREVLPTAALVQISLPVESWQAVDQSTRGQLVQIWRPGDLEEPA